MSADARRDHPTLAISVDDVRDAARVLGDDVHRTPLIRSRSFDDVVGATVLHKAEHLQRTGSFKIRGALNRIRRLDDTERARGVVAFSSGNHAQGVALAARLCGTSATIVMPHDAPAVKVAAVRSYGATVVVYDRVRDDREQIARTIVEETGATLVPPFDDPHVMAGQGTVGLELAEDAPPLDLVLVPIGGGGLVAGIATAVRAVQPQARVIGVEPSSADDARQSLALGRIVRIPQPRTVADGVATQQVGALTFPVIQALVDEIVTVDDALILQAQRWMMERMKQVVEPTGALTAAALMSGAIDARGRIVGSIVCGGNADLDALGRPTGTETAATSPAAEGSA